MHIFENKTSEIFAFVHKRRIDIKAKTGFASQKILRRQLILPGYQKIPVAFDIYFNVSPGVFGDYNILPDLFPNLRKNIFRLFDPDQNRFF